MVAILQAIAKHTKPTVQVSYITQCHSLFYRPGPLHGPWGCKIMSKNPPCDITYMYIHICILMYEALRHVHNNNYDTRPCIALHQLYNDQYPVLSPILPRETINTRIKSNQIALCCYHNARSTVESLNN